MNGRIAVFWLSLQQANTMKFGDSINFQHFF